jgi:hypothetical protein
MKSSWESGGGRTVTELKQPSKAKTLSQAIEDLKKEIMAWGGTIETITTMEANGKVQETVMKIKFRMH